MRYLARITLCAIVAFVLLLGLSRFAGAWFGEDINVLTLGRWVLFETRRTDTIDVLREAVDTSRARKSAIVKELIEGRLTLPEAAAQFREADTVIERGDPDMVAGYFTPRTEAGLAAQVLIWVRAEAERLPPEESRRVVRSIEKQFEELYGSPPSSDAPPEVPGQ